MREALAQAEAAGRAGELPIGAVLVVGDEVVSRGRTRQNERSSQLAHAELEALQGGGDALWTRHDEGVLFTTVEPCPMCLGAVVLADLPHVVFACSDAIVQSHLMVELPYIRRHIATYRGGVLEHEARELLACYSPKLLEALGAQRRPDEARVGR